MTLTEWVLVGGWLLAPFVLIFLARHWHEENQAVLEEQKTMTPLHIVLGNMSGSSSGT